MARSSAGGVTIGYAFLAVRMASLFAVVGRVAMHGLSIVKYSAPRGVARPGRSLMSMNALLPVAINESTD